MIHSDDYLYEDLHNLPAIYVDAVRDAYGKVDAGTVTDTQLAQLVAAWLAETDRAVAFTPGRGWLLADEDGLWRSGEYLVRRCMLRLAEELLHTAGNYLSGDLRTTKDGKPRPDAQTANMLRRVAEVLQSRRAKDRAIQELADHCAVEDGAFDGDPDVIAARDPEGGYLRVDLRTGRSQPLDSSDRVTRALDIAYRPDATAPRWERFLNEVLVSETGGPTDTEMVTWLQKVIGYGITGHRQEQFFLTLHGTGANGKSLLADTLRYVFAPVTETAEFSTFTVAPNQAGPTPEVAKLAGSRLVIASEGDADVRIAEGRVKALTGDEVITARHLNKAPMTFPITFLIVLVSNHKPDIVGTDNGIWRRVRLVPFLNTFPVDGGQLEAALRAEAEGILAWAVRGAVEWYALRDRGESLPIPATVRDQNAEYRAEQDRLAEFLESPAVVIGPGERGQSTALYKAYSDWCWENAEKYPLGKKRFYDQLWSRGYRKVKRSRGYVLLGIRASRDVAASTERTAAERATPGVFARV